MKKLMSLVLSLALCGAVMAAVPFAVGHAEEPAPSSTSAPEPTPTPTPSPEPNPDGDNPEPHRPPRKMIDIQEECF